MSLPLPLTVRLATAAGDRHITRKLRDLSFRVTAPGGFASIQMSLDEPLTGQPDYLDYYGRAYVYDARTGATLCEGRLEDPGRSAGRDGQVWDLVAVGPAAHARDRNIPLIYVDRRLEPWEKAAGTSNERPSSTVSRTDDAGSSGAQALVLAFPAGLTIPTNAACTAVYYPIERAGQNLAVLGYRWDAGVTNASWVIAGYSSGAHLVRSQGASTAGGAFAVSTVGTGSFTAGDRRPYLKVSWNSGASSTGGSDDVWASFMDVVVRATTYSKTGVEQVSGYTSADITITASTVVADLLGRLLPQYDGANASIAATSFGIDQLAYPDGIDAAGVLDDLMALEPAYLWEALESNPVNGKNRFAWRQWPTSVRYEASVVDGYDGPGSAAGLYNEVTVRWRDTRGQTRTTTVTQSVPLLTAAGLTRSPKPIDLGDNVGSSADATQAGQQFLAEHRYPPNAGRLRIARKILDLQTGTMVAPWEIRPGYLIRVRGVLPRIDALNNSTRDGVTVFKIASMEFRASDAAATLDLDTYAASTARALADLLGRPETRRR